MFAACTALPLASDAREPRRRAGRVAASAPVEEPAIASEASGPEHEGGRGVREPAATLRRTLGLPAALSIGLGTMIGAGIFLFPGLAAGRAGSGAVLSFLLGGAIAFLVALPAAEMATAMPLSGGPYHFVSRGLGKTWGAIAGLGQWAGLVFASAFYLAGAGHYVGDALHTVGLGVEVPPAWLGVLIGGTLVVVATVGMRESGRLQAWIVGILLALLLGFLLFGGLRVLGVSGPEPGVDEPFLPYGALPVFTTAALVFTSFLGFAQVAAVGGEIREPSRNLPRALLGSVVVVTLLYVAVVGVATRLLPSERMGELGETAMTEVARVAGGAFGAGAFLAAGLLATVSSANASILAASRGLFALGRGRLVSDRVVVTHPRFGTPHRALWLVGGAIVALILLGRLELLAQVASIVHLVLYALMCFAMIALRRRSAPDYEPGFRCPGYPWVPLVGGIACLGLLAFMPGAPLAVGGGILLAAAGWRGLLAWRRSGEAGD